MIADLLGQGLPGLPGEVWVFTGTVAVYVVFEAFLALVRRGNDAVQLAPRLDAESALAIEALRPLPLRDVSSASPH